MLFAVATYPLALERLPKDIDGVEMRLDLFPTLFLPEIKKLLNKCPVPVMFTLRKASHGGRFAGEEGEREKLIEELIALKPAYFDLECDMRPAFIEKMQNQYPATKIVCSYHNFTETPDLHQIHFPKCHFYKIATMANSAIDALRLLDFIKDKNKNEARYTGLAMGEKGQFARILGPLIGNLIDYGSLNTIETTAPGQLTCDDLNQIYHYHVLSPKTAVYGLIGDPIEGSMGHIIHNQVYDKLNLDAVYVKISLKLEELTDFFHYYKKLNFRGLSVTMPLKEAVIPFLDRVDPETQKIGAINTIVPDSGALTGYNTDGKGALDAIEAKLKVRGKHLVILGAGGGAKGIAYAAKARGANLTILNRTVEKALKLAAELDCEAGSLDEIPAHYDILVNCTLGTMPIPLDRIIPKTVVFDMIYVPKHTPFLQAAESKQCILVFGYEMFLNQAAEQFALWFKHRPDLFLKNFI